MLDAYNSTSNFLDEIGNANAAQDLYGLGVRLGIYFQCVGMSLSLIRLKSGGIKLACAGLMLAIMGCWIRLVKNKEISPSEALTIVIIANALSTPAMAAAICPTLMPWNEIVGVIATYGALLLSMLSLTAFWATLYRGLPRLGTPNKAFFFVAVKIDGWFRILSLITSVLGVIGCLVVSFGVFFVIRAYVKQEADKDTVDFMAGSARAFAFISLLLLPFFVAHAEMNIKYNHLQPTTDLAQPGQSIPLAIGIITMVDGVLAIWSDADGE